MKENGDTQRTKALTGLDRPVSKAVTVGIRLCTGGPSHVSHVKTVLCSHLNAPQ